METVELMTILAQGEDSQHQFKQTIPHRDSLAQEMVAFSNGLGGKIIIGVDDAGVIVGLTNEELRELNQLIANVASGNVRPAINPTTQNILTEFGLVVIINIPAGINKPYQDNKGDFWVKNGSDKRKSTSREEIQRLFQTSGLLHADESLANGLTIADLDMDYFSAFFQKRYGESLENQSLTLEKTIQNLNLGRDGMLNLTGALLFAKNPSIRLPSFIVKAGCFPGTDMTGESYIDSRNIEGKIADIFQQTISFVLANIKQIQGDQSVNSVGLPEIPRIALEEIIVNALVHRDYFISAPIRVFVFKDRIEVISPGHLPNNLTMRS